MIHHQLDLSTLCAHTYVALWHIRHGVHNSEAAHAPGNMDMMVSQAIRRLEDTIQVDDPVFVPSTCIPGML